MTIIVALRGPTGVDIGCDTLSTRNGYYQLHVKTKWIQLGKYYWVGCAGNARLRTMLSGLGRSAVVQARPGALGILEMIRELIIADGWKPEERPGDPNHYGIEGVITDGDEMLSFGGGFAAVDDGDLQCAGVGEDIARGVYLALRERGESRPMIVQRMIEIAGMLHRDCGGFWGGFVPKPRLSPEAVIL